MLSIRLETQQLKAYLIAVSVLEHYQTHLIAHCLTGRNSFVCVLLCLKNDDVHSLHSERLPTLLLSSLVHLTRLHEHIRRCNTKDGSQSGHAPFYCF